MKISSSLVDRPVATVLLYAVLLVVGACASMYLPESMLPEVDSPSIEVTATYPGASPEVMQRTVGAALMHTLSQISGLETIVSIAGSGNVRVLLRFNLAEDINEAAENVQAAISAASGWIPVSQLPAPPIWSKVNPADTPVMTLALTMPTAPQYEMSDIAARYIIPRLSNVAGVGEIQIEGAAKKATRIEINVSLAASKGLSLENIRNAIIYNSATSPTGAVELGSQSFAIADNAQLESTIDFSDAVVASSSMGLIRLAELGNVGEDTEDISQAAWYGTERAILLDVKRQPGANSVEIARQVRAALPRIMAFLPGTAKLSVMTDLSVAVKSSVHDVTTTLFVSILLVSCVIALFIQRTSFAMVPVAIIPASYGMALGVMLATGHSLNTLSMMGLVVSSGFIVDDAIIMIENIAFLAERGDGLKAACKHGADQITFTIVALSAALSSTMIPLLFAGGSVGLLFKDFAETIIILVVCSAAATIALTPSLVSILSWKQRNATHPTAGNTVGKLYYLAGRVFSVYDSALLWVLRRCKLVSIFLLFLAFATVLLFVTMPKGLLPETHTGVVDGFMTVEANASRSAMRQITKGIEGLIARDKRIESVDAVVGSLSPYNQTDGSVKFTLVFKPAVKIAADQKEALDEFRREASQEFGVGLSFRVRQPITLNTESSPGEYQIAMTGPSAVAIRKWSEEILPRLRETGLFADLYTNATVWPTSIDLAVDRQAAAHYGLTIADISSDIYDQFGQRQISQILSNDGQSHVVLQGMKHPTSIVGFPDLVYTKPVTSASGGLASPEGRRLPYPDQVVPLSTVVRARLIETPSVISYRDSSPSTLLSFNLRPGSNLESAIDSIVRVTAKSVPGSTEIKIFPVGALKEFQTSLTSEPALIGLAVIAIYVILGVLYESFLQPLTILSTLPPAGLGAFLAMRGLGLDLNVISVVGVLVLVGVVSKNGIMLVDYALTRMRESGLTPEVAAREAALRRFRPIMMTTACAFFGAIPLLLPNGGLTEFERPVGIALVSGLVISQTITLFSMPAVFVVVCKIGSWKRKKQAPQS